jgi:hypothetical protein
MMINKLFQEGRDTMDRKQFITVTLLVLLAALCGAFMASFLIEDSNASNQHMSFASVTSRQFRLVDASGKWRGEMLVDARGPALIVLSDPQGRVRLRIGVNENGIPFIQDSGGRSIGGQRSTPSLPPTQLISRPGGGGKGDSASAADARVNRDEINALWQQIRIVKERVDLLSR